MKITASIKNSALQNEVIVNTEGSEKQLSIPGKTVGRGSSVNGGELLFLALATCFCNDIYRESARRNINIHSVEVTVSGEFGNEGEPASSIKYKTDIHSDASEEEILALIIHVDKIAEIHNTLRLGVDVSLDLS